MSNVRILVVAGHAMIGALLGALVELAGYRPLFADVDERPDAAIERLEPDLVLLDCELAAAAEDDAYRAAFEAGSRLLLFGSSLTAVETERFAARRGAPCITLPIGYTAFSERVKALLDDRSERTVARELRDGASA